MFRVVKRRKTSKRMYFLTCHGANPSKNTVYDALRPYGRRIRLTGWYNKWCLYSAALSSCRHDIASTLMRGCLNFAGPLSNNNRIQLHWNMTKYFLGCNKPSWYALASFISLIYHISWSPFMTTIFIKYVPAFCIHIHYSVTYTIIMTNVIEFCTSLVLWRWENGFHTYKGCLLKTTLIWTHLVTVQMAKFQRLDSLL